MQQREVLRFSQKKIRIQSLAKFEQCKSQVVVMCKGKMEAILNHTKVQDESPHLVHVLAKRRRFKVQTLTSVNRKLKQ